MSNNSQVICEIGPGTDMPGGMLTVIQTIMKSSELKKFDLVHIASASAAGKVRTFATSLIRYFGMCIRGKVALAHIHMSERGSCFRAIVFIKISRLFNIPVIVHSHGSEFENYYNSLSARGRRTLNGAMRYASRVLVLTNGWIKFWRQIVKEDKITVLPNSVKAQDSYDKKYLINNRLNILFLGYIGTRKGTFDLINAIRLLRDSKHKIHLVVGGNGEIEHAKSSVREFNLQSQVDVAGWLNADQKERAFEDADVLVLPSVYESFGIVILEAFAHKVPAICGDGGYSKEVVSDGVDGYVVESGNVDQIANRLTDLSDLQKLEKFGLAGYRKVKENYSEKIVMRRLRQIYDSDKR